jgi:hypothetical protein
VLGLPPLLPLPGQQLLLIIVINFMRSSSPSILLLFLLEANHMVGLGWTGLKTNFFPIFFQLEATLNPNPNPNSENWGVYDQFY